MSFLKNLFGKSPEEEAKEWIRNLRKEQRQVELQVNKIQREQNKVKIAMKQAAKKDDTASLRILALELVRSKKAVSRLYAAKAKMNSVSIELQHQMAQMKMMGAMQKSTEVMHEMNELVRIPEVTRTMREMSKEMTKAGMIDEMMNDTIDDALDDDISDTELEEEVNQVVEETMEQQMGTGMVPRTKLPGQKQKVQTGHTAQHMETLGED
eukprot:gene8204-5729_t